MFVPRQVKHHTIGAHPGPLPKSKASRSPPASTPPATPQAEPASPKPPKPEIDPTVAKDIVASLEQLLGSFNPHAQWLEERRREIEGQEDYIHFAALMECPFFEDTKPTLSQVLLRRALASAPSDKLEVCSAGYYVRYTGCRAQIYDENTVYIEPATTGITTHPGTVARMLASSLPSTLLPVLYTQTGGKSWALVTLSGPVSEEQTSPNSGIWPPNWMVLTKAEWKRRDAEYQKHRNSVLRSRHQAMLEEKMSRMHIDNSHVSAGETTTFRQDDHEPGLIVHITNLHPDVTKPTISSFIDRAVDRYIQRQEKKAAESTGRLEEYLSEKKNHSPSKKTTMLYIDYKKGSTEAWVRQATKEDSLLIIEGLDARRRTMKDKDDRTGQKIPKGEEGKHVKGRLLEGKEEADYWDTIRYAKEHHNMKKGYEKASIEGFTIPTNVSPNHGDRPKRPRMFSNVGGSASATLGSKKLRYDED